MTDGNEGRAKAKSPLDMHVRCGCGGSFSLEVEPGRWSYPFGSAMVELCKAWVASHAKCCPPPPTKGTSDVEK